MSILYIDYLAAISVLIPLLASIYFYRLSNRDLQFFAIFIFISSFFNLIVTIVGVYNINNLWLLSIFTLVEYCSLTFIFSLWVKRNHIKLALRWSIPLFFLVWLGLKIFGIEKTNEFPNFMEAIGSLIFTIVAVYILIQLLEFHEDSIFKSYKFWISMGVLLFYPATSIIFLLSDLELLDIVWTIHSIMDIVGNICYACAFFSLHPRLNST